MATITTVQPKVQWHRGPVEFVKFEDVIRLILCVCIMLCNLVVVIIFLANDSLRYFSECFLVNLCMTGMLSGGVALLHLMTSVSLGDHTLIHVAPARILELKEKMPAATPACLAQLMISRLVFFSGPFCMIIVSIDRYWRIYNIAKYRKYQQKTTFVMMISAPWICSFCFFLLPELFLRIDHSFGNVKSLSGTCSSIYIGRKTFQLFENSVMAVTLLILVVFNAYIYWLFRKRFVDRTLGPAYPLLDKLRDMFCCCTRCFKSKSKGKRQSSRTMAVNEAWAMCNARPESDEVSLASVYAHDVANSLADNISHLSRMDSMGSVDAVSWELVEAHRTEEKISSEHALSTLVTISHSDTPAVLASGQLQSNDKTDVDANNTKHLDTAIEVADRDRAQSFCVDDPSVVTELNYTVNIKDPTEIYPSWQFGAANPVSRSNDVEDLPPEATTTKPLSVDKSEKPELSLTLYRQESSTPSDSRRSSIRSMRPVFKLQPSMFMGKPWHISAQNIQGPFFRISMKPVAKMYSYSARNSLVSSKTPPIRILHTPEQAAAYVPRRSILRNRPQSDAAPLIVDRLNSVHVPQSSWHGLTLSQQRTHHVKIKHPSLYTLAWSLATAMKPLQEIRRRKLRHRLLLDMTVTAMTLQVCLVILTLLSWIPYLIVRFQMVVQCMPFYDLDRHNSSTPALTDACEDVMPSQVTYWLLYSSNLLLPVLVVLVHKRASNILLLWWRRTFHAN